MNNVKTAGAVTLAILICVAAARGQNPNDHQNEEQQSAPEAKFGTPVKILVVISEFDGGNKIGSLPYTLYTVTAGPADPHSGARQSMRYQLHVPILSGNYPTEPASKGITNYQYRFQDVGTDIDYGAYLVGDDSYELVFTVDRSWASTPGPASKQVALERGSVLTGQPILPHFRNSFIVVLKNGQTVEGASATDPVSGHVLKIDVTLTALK